LTNSHPLHKKDGSDESYQEAISRCLRREWGIGLPVRKIFGFNLHVWIKFRQPLNHVARIVADTTIFVLVLSCLAVNTDDH